MTQITFNEIICGLNTQARIAAENSRRHTREVLAQRRQAPGIMKPVVLIESVEDIVKHELNESEVTP